MSWQVYILLGFVFLQGGLITFIGWQSFNKTHDWRSELVSALVIIIGLLVEGTVIVQLTGTSA
jgi:hypothetical protein